MRRHAPSSLPLTDQELLMRVRAGDTSHYGMLIKRYHNRLYCIALRILKNEADAEDALQDACIMGLTRLEQFAGRSSFFTWMARITMNEAFSRIRSRRRSQRLEAALSSPGDLHRYYVPVSTPEQLTVQREMAHVLESSMRTLPESYRTVFQMREIEEASTMEAAHHLGLTEECVKTRLHRARELLRRRVGKRVKPRSPAQCLAA